MPPPSSLPNGQPAVRRLAPQPNGISSSAAPPQAYPTAPTPKGDSPLLGAAQIGTPRTPQINGNGSTPNQRGSRKRTADGNATKEGGAKVSYAFMASRSADIVKNQRLSTSPKGSKDRNQSPKAKSNSRPDQAEETGQPHAEQNNMHFEGHAGVGHPMPIGPLEVSE